VSAGPASGWTWPAMPIAAATARILCGRTSGVGATGRSKPSTATCRSISSRSSSSPAICCRRPASRRASPRPSIATR
jgi:hypothetical protein